MPDGIFAGSEKQVITLVFDNRHITYQGMRSYLMPNYVDGEYLFDWTPCAGCFGINYVLLGGPDLQSTCALLQTTSELISFNSTTSVVFSSEHTSELAPSLRPSFSAPSPDLTKVCYRAPSELVGSKASFSAVAAHNTTLPPIAATFYPEPASALRLAYEVTPSGESRVCIRSDDPSYFLSMGEWKYLIFRMDLSADRGRPFSLSSHAKADSRVIKVSRDDARAKADEIQAYTAAQEAKGKTPWWKQWVSVGSQSDEGLIPGPFVHLCKTLDLAEIESPDAYPRTVIGNVTWQEEGYFERTFLERSPEMIRLDDPQNDPLPSPPDWGWQVAAFGHLTPANAPGIFGTSSVSAEPHAVVEGFFVPPKVSCERRTSPWDDRVFPLSWGVSALILLVMLRASAPCCTHFFIFMFIIISPYVVWWVYDSAMMPCGAGSATPLAYGYVSNLTPTKERPPVIWVHPVFDAIVKGIGMVIGGFVSLVIAALPAACMDATMASNCNSGCEERSACVPCPWYRECLDDMWTWCTVRRETKEEEQPLHAKEPLAVQKAPASPKKKVKRKVTTAVDADTAAAVESGGAKADGGQSRPQDQQQAVTATTPAAMMYQPLPMSVEG